MRLSGRTATIFVATHRPDTAIDLPFHTVIRSGQAAAAANGELTDRLSFGGGLDNRRWSELSAIYRVWREGPRFDIVGFCHYRRFFFTPMPASPSVRIISRADIAKSVTAEGIRSILNLVDDETIVVAEPFRFTAPVFLHYARRHHVSDYLKMAALSATTHPQIASGLASHLWRRTMYPCNLFVMTWENFDALCRVWFDVLPRVADATPWPRENGYQSRDVSFLAERLFDVWVRRQQREGKRVAALPFLYAPD